MPRMYVVSRFGFADETLATSALVADLICAVDVWRHKDTLIAQIRTLNPGDTAYLSGGTSINVIGYGEEEEPPPPPPPLPEGMGY